MALRALPTVSDEAEAASFTMCSARSSNWCAISFVAFLVRAMFRLAAISSIAFLAAWTTRFSSCRATAGGAFASGATVFPAEDLGAARGARFVAAGSAAGLGLLFPEPAATGFFFPVEVLFGLRDGGVFFACAALLFLSAIGDF